MTDDALAALERARRILEAGASTADILADLMPEYTRGAKFAYSLAFQVLDKEIEYIKQDRAARAG